MPQAVRLPPKYRMEPFSWMLVKASTVRSRSFFSANLSRAASMTPFARCRSSVVARITWEMESLQPQTSKIFMSALISSSGWASALEAVAVKSSAPNSSRSRSAMAARILAVDRSFSVVVGEWKFRVSERMAPSISPARDTGMGIWFSRKMVATMVQVEPTISFRNWTGYCEEKSLIRWWSMTSSTWAFSMARTDWENSLWSTRISFLLGACMM